MSVLDYLLGEGSAKTVAMTLVQQWFGELYTSGRLKMSSDDFWSSLQKITDTINNIETTAPEFYDHTTPPTPNPQG